MSLQIKHSLQKLQERVVKKLSSSNKGRQYLQPDLASILHSRDHWDQWTPKPPHVPNKPGQVLYLVVQGTVSWWNCSQDQVSGGRQKKSEVCGAISNLNSCLHRKGAYEPLVKRIYRLTSCIKIQKKKQKSTCKDYILPLFPKSFGKFQLLLRYSLSSLLKRSQPKTTLQNSHPPNPP